jgi:hypothetical protein
MSTAAPVIVRGTIELPNTMGKVLLVLSDCCQHPPRSQRKPTLRNSSQRNGLYPSHLRDGLGNANGGG